MRMRYYPISAALMRDAETGNADNALAIMDRQVNMTNIPSVDRSLSRASSWLSYAAFLGVVALAFLPPQVRPASKTESKPIADASKPAAEPSSASAGAASTAPAASAATSAGAASAGPAPDVWTQQEVVAGLRQCLQLLAPTGADIGIEEPMKHGQCGTAVPLELRSVGNVERVTFSPPPTMNCRLAAQLAGWVEKVLQPTAQQVLGAHIKQIVGASSYSCRNIYNNPKLSLSEHATGNAIDIVGFVTTDGRTITVSKGWGPTERDIAEAKKKAAEKVAAKGDAKDAPKEKDTATPAPSIEDTGKKAETKEKGKVVKTSLKQDPPKAASSAADAKLPVPSTTKEATFLKRLHGGACTLFATVLGPEANEAHRDHFHLDMKVRQSGAGVCH